MKIKQLIRTCCVTFILALFSSLTIPAKGDVSESKANSGEMVLVEGGVLSTDNRLEGSEVESFLMARTPVTWEEWKRIREWAVDHGYDLHEVGDGCAADHPVYNVSWYDVIKWSNARSEKEGFTPVYTVEEKPYREGQVVPEKNLSADGYRLPGEAEWEFAARGGIKSSGYTYAGGDELAKLGWYRGNSEGADCDLQDGRGTWPVGQKKANELELYDMSGMVFEWCWDSWSETHPYRMIRGGSFQFVAESASVSVRIRSDPETRDQYRGFRLARNIP